MRKRVMSTFRYRDCDAFAEYLHQQSLLGWHFKEWRFGLVFEKGESADICYIVEIFPNGTEMDTRPEEEAQEYAQYCEAAGWKLLDSNRKFCIFRRENPDAIAIVEPQERFKNIRKAEWRLWLSLSIPIFFLTGMQWFHMLSWNFKNWIFSDAMLLTLLFMSLVSVQRLSELLILLYWSYTRNKQLNSGKIPIYGKRKHWDSRVFTLLLFLPFIGLLMCSHEQIFQPLFLPIAVTLILCLLIVAGIAIWRPSRADNWTFQMAAAGVIMVSYLTLTMAIIFSKPAPISTDTDDFPLVQADYRHMDGEIVSVNEDHIEGFLGSANRYYIDYGKESFSDSTSENIAETDSLRYTIYQSRYPWVLNKLWREEMPDSKDSFQERTTAWDSLAAISQNDIGLNYKELVRYPDRILVLYSTERLEDTEIEIIRHKLPGFSQ